MDQAEIQIIKNTVQGMDKTQRAMFYESKDKSVGIAMVLSIFLAGGAGLLYIGKIGKGIVIILLSWLVVPYFLGLYFTYKDTKAYNALLYSIVFPPEYSGQVATSPPSQGLSQQSNTQASSFCSHCGAPISQGVKFCASCGSAV